MKLPKSSRTPAATKQGKTPDGERQPTANMARIADLAGVSKMTVSRALSGSKLVAPATRDAIRAIAEQFGYVPDATGTFLSSGRSGMVAALVPTVGSSNFPNVLEGLSRSLRGSGIELMIGRTNFDPDEEERIVEAMLRRRPEGIMLTGDTHTERTVRLLRAVQIPVVETWDIPDNPIGHIVGLSDERAAKVMVRHLYEQGYRRIGFVTSAQAKVYGRGLKRQKGYESALQELGIAERRTIEFGSAPMTMEDGAEALTIMRRMWPDTDAIFFASDAAAFGALMECHRAGIAVPDAMAIAGFGNFDVSRMSHPRLTTIDVDAYNVGFAAGTVIQQALADEKAGLAPKRQVIVMQAKLLARQTT